MEARFWIICRADIFINAVTQILYCHKPVGGPVRELGSSSGDKNPTVEPANLFWENQWSRLVRLKPPLSRLWSVCAWLKRIVHSSSGLHWLEGQYQGADYSRQLTTWQRGIYRSGECDWAIGCRPVMVQLSETLLTVRMKKGALYTWRACDLLRRHLHVSACGRVSFVPIATHSGRTRLVSEYLQIKTTIICRSPRKWKHRWCRLYYFGRGQGFWWSERLREESRGDNVLVKIVQS